MLTNRQQAQIEAFELSQAQRRDIRVVQMEAQDNPEAFLRAFERVAEGSQWPRKDWSAHLAPLLSGEPLAIFHSLPFHIAENYDHLKNAILEKVSMSEEMYRQKFRSVTFPPGAQPHFVAQHLSDLGRKWLKPRFRNPDEIVELIIVEQFIRILPEGAKRCLSRHHASSLDFIVGLLEEYFSLGVGRPENINAYLNRSAHNPKSQCQGFGSANHGINRNIENWEGPSCRNPLNTKRVERLENPLAQFGIEGSGVMPRFEEWKDAHIAGQPDIVQIERTKSSAMLPATAKSKSVPVTEEEEDCFIMDITKPERIEGGETYMAGHMAVNSESEHKVQEAEDCFIVDKLELERRPSASVPAVNAGDIQRIEELASNYTKVHSDLEKGSTENDKGRIVTGNRKNMSPIKGMARLLSALAHSKESCENSKAGVAISKPVHMEESEHYENPHTMGSREPERRAGIMNTVTKTAEIKLAVQPRENLCIQTRPEPERTEISENSKAGSMAVKEKNISPVVEKKTPSALNHPETDQRYRNTAEFVTVKSRHAPDIEKRLDSCTMVPPESEQQERLKNCQAGLVPVKQENVAKIEATERPCSMDLCDSESRGMKEHFDAAACQEKHHYAVTGIAASFKETSSDVQSNSLAEQSLPAASSLITNSKIEKRRSPLSVESDLIGKSITMSHPPPGLRKQSHHKTATAREENLESGPRYPSKQQHAECHEEQKPNALSAIDEEHGKRDYGEINFTIMRTPKGNRACISMEHAKIWSKTSMQNPADCSKRAERRKIPAVRQREHVERKYACTECGMRFRYDASRRRHQARTGEKTSTCVVCGKVFISVSCLLWHQQTHSEHNPHACAKCGKRFRLRTSLYRHLRTHPQQEPYSCSVCGSSFKHLGSLHRHELIHTGPYPCPQCGKNFKYPSALLLHERIHKYKPCICAECGKTFTDESSLHRHKQVHTANKRFSCTKCRKSFKDSATLQIHEQKHAAQRPYSCTECRKSFLYASSLHSHYRMHTGEKLYPCTECGKSFLNQSSMQRHQKKSHSAESPKGVLPVKRQKRKGAGKYQCIQCGKNFNNQSRLSRHHQMHIKHSEKPYVCVDCGKRFSDPLLLHNHEQVHFTKKKFRCDQCGKRFRIRKSLTIHYRIHTGEKPYSCTECERRFSDPSCWRKHLKKHQKQ